MTRRPVGSSDYLHIEPRNPSYARQQAALGITLGCLTLLAWATVAGIIYLVRVF